MPDRGRQRDEHHLDLAGDDFPDCRGRALERHVDDFYFLRALEELTREMANGADLR